MAYLNKVMLIGNLGKDPEFHATQGGGRLVRFSIATSRRYRDSNGETKEQTDWLNVTGWGKTADTIKQLGIRKGMSLYVEGTLTNRSWTDPTSGQKRYATEVGLQSFQLLTPRQQQQQSNPYSRAAQEASAGAADDMQGYDPDTDLPF